MSSAKLVKFKRKVGITGVTWLADVATVTTAVPHLLLTGDSVMFVDPINTTFYNEVVTVTGASEFTITSDDPRVTIPSYLLFDELPATFTGSTEISTLNTSNRTYQATVTTTAGSGSGGVVIEVSNDGVGWKTLGTITLTSGASPVSEGFASQEAWLMARARVTSIVGTGAILTVCTAGAN